MTLNILNLGAGVQSSAVLLLSVRGELPKFDAAIFADTGWEPKRVYANLDWLTEQAEGASIPVHRVSVGRNIREEATRRDDKRFATLPLRTVSPDGKKGKLRRQCTREFKIEPIERFIRRGLLGLKPRQHAPANAVRQWLGISADEAHRMRTSDAKWHEFVYPLCGVPEDFLDRPWTRRMCADWLRKNYPGRDFPRSACIGCPFRANEEWIDLKKDPEEWADAIAFDEEIRDRRGYRGLESLQYVHRSYGPLAEADLGKDRQAADWGDECAGVCGV